MIFIIWCLQDVMLELDDFILEKRKFVFTMTDKTDLLISPYGGKLIDLLVKGEGTR